MNQTILIGRLVRDVDLRFMPDKGLAVGKFTLAIDRKLTREKKAAEQAAGRPTADYIQIVTLGKLAEICGDNIAKGRMVAVQGEIRSGSYKTPQGETKYTTNVLADKVEFLDKQKSEAENNQPMSGGGSEYNPDDFQSIEDDEMIPF